MLFPLILAFIVLLVNGWTDAPGAIATAVSSRAIKYKKACILCGIFNFLGVIIATLISTSIAEFVFSLGTFDQYITIGISIVLFTMIAFGVVSSFFGMPSSESHAMLCSLAGVSCAVKFEASSIKTLGYVFVFMVFSCFLALVLGCLFSKGLKFALPYNSLQIISLCLNSIMHGWQGGLKFIGVIAFLLNINITNGVPIILTLSVALTLALGSLMGGKKIINSMGKDLVALNSASALATDISTYLTLLICTLMGMPVSTGNVKCISIIGAGLLGGQGVNKKTATRLIASFIAVFPICFLMGYFLMRLFMLLN